MGYEPPFDEPQGRRSESIVHGRNGPDRLKPGSQGPVLHKERVDRNVGMAAKPLEQIDKDRGCTALRSLVAGDQQARRAPTNAVMGCLDPRVLTTEDVGKAATGAGRRRQVHACSLWALVCPASASFSGESGDAFCPPRLTGRTDLSLPEFSGASRYPGSVTSPRTLASGSIASRGRARIRSVQAWWPIQSRPLINT